MKQHGPWKIKSSEAKYKNPWFEVIEDKVIRPDGKEGIYGTVKIKEGVSVLPIDEKGFVYLINEFKYPLGRESIETVGAGTDEVENHLESAKRELKEELGIEAQEWIDLGVVHPVTSFLNSPNYLYLAKDLSFVKAKPDASETLEPLKVSLEEAVKMVMDGRITEQKSCVLILKAAKHLGKL